MKFASALYRFLGGIKFAIFLIASAALFVIAGTFLESYTSSHLFAARFTYGNPIFGILLWGFFVNILLSTLRRWPFQSKHIPFIITHIGLLMIFGGAIIKNYVGIQGNMEIMEGSGSHEILLPHTFSIQIQKRDGTANYHGMDSKMFRIAEYIPHAREKKEAWIYGNLARISGLNPFPVFKEEEQADLPVSSKALLTPLTIWKIFAFESKDSPSTAARIYLQDLQLILKDPETESVIYEGSLKKALEGPIDLGDAFILVDLNFKDRMLEIEKHSPQFIKPEKSRIELSGQNSLINSNALFPNLGPAIITELQNEPAFVLLKEQDDIHLHAFDPWGRISSQSYQSLTPNSLVMFEQGFGGYAAQATFLFGQNLESMQKFRHEKLTQALAPLKNDPTLLIPPLQMLKKACQLEQIDFNSCFIELLEKMKHSPTWILSGNLHASNQLEKALNAIDWKNLKGACQWLCLIQSDVERRIKNGKSFKQALQAMGWPLLKYFEDGSEQTLEQSMKILSQQILDAKNIIPPLPEASYSNLSLFAAFLRGYGIHLDDFPVESMPLQNFTLESPVSFQFERLSPLLKAEENQPKILLEINNGGKRELIPLLYDPSGNGLKKPSRDGHFLFRFQPMVKEIPHHVRLHQARQINYPGINQPFSYESDVTVSNKNTGQAVEKTISMNQVHETLDGYRFYMANIGTDGSDVKKVLIVVNHDPAKYWLTYPGAFLVCLGIFLLFWVKPKSSALPKNLDQKF